jgi:hypothetical protein
MKTVRILMFASVLMAIVGLMFWSRKPKEHDTIEVEFIKEGATEAFAVSKVPIAQLPATFELATTLDIAEKKWTVLHAQPKQKIDFQKTGRLRVILRPIALVNPKDILFSLPTINDRMCALRKAESLDGFLMIHEDDWRQIEFISESLVGDIGSEMDGIRKIFESKRKASGFTEMHIRKVIETPMAKSGISYQGLKQLFRISIDYNGFGVGQAAADRGFAFETKEGLQFYGVRDREGNIEALCLRHADGVAETCRDLMKDFHLVCVNWCRMQIIRN